MIELINITTFDAMIPVSVLSLFLYGSLSIFVARIVYEFFIRPIFKIHI